MKQTSAPVHGMYRVNVREIWRWLTKQPASFWLINFYVFLEYVRPQTVWPVFDILPWAQLTIIATAAALIIEGRLPQIRTQAGLLLMVFSLVVILSSITALRPAESFKGWELYFSWVLVFLLITNIVTTERRFYILMLAFLLYSFKMSQHGFRTWAGRGFAFADWGVTGAPGWFHNSGEFGIQMCIFLPLAVEFIIAMRSYWNRLTRWFFYSFPITAVGGAIASTSRGAQLGVACLGLWWIARSKHRGRSLIAVAAVMAIGWAVMPEEQKMRFTTAGSDNTSITRLERWEAGIEMALERPILGIGYNNWSSYYGPLSHNIFIEALSELGFTGFTTFLLLIGSTFALNWKTRALLRKTPTETPFMYRMAYGLDGALIGYMVSGFFVTVLYYPYFWINLAMTVCLHVAARGANTTWKRARHADAIRAGGSTATTAVPSY